MAPQRIDEYEPADTDIEHWSSNCRVCDVEHNTGYVGCEFCCYPVCEDCGHEHQLDVNTNWVTMCSECLAWPLQE